MPVMKARCWSLMAVVLLAGCDSPAERLLSPSDEALSSFSNGGCLAPTVVFPEDSSTFADSNTRLRWAVQGDCRWENRIEVYDDNSSLVWYDAVPKWKTYQIDTSTFEYRYLEFSSLTRGHYYKWRLRTHELDTDGQTILQTSPWSSFGWFGVRPATPNTTGSVQSDRPKLNWSAAEGAASYKIYRKLDTVGTWDHATTVSATDYLDFSTVVTGYLGADVVPSGNWVAYHVVSVGNGMQSAMGSAHFFSYDQGTIQPEFVDDEMED